jgi:transcription elongation factor Elf1
MGVTGACRHRDSSLESPCLLDSDKKINLLVCSRCGLGPGRAQGAMEAVL